MADLKVRGVDEELWRRARVFALGEGLTMGELVSRALAAFIAPTAGASGRKRPSAPSYLPPCRRPLGATLGLTEGVPAVGPDDDEDLDEDGSVEVVEGSGVPFVAPAWGSKPKSVSQPKRKRKGKR